MIFAIELVIYLFLGFLTCWLIVFTKLIKVYKKFGKDVLEEAANHTWKGLTSGLTKTNVLFNLFINWTLWPIFMLKGVKKMTEDIEKEAEYISSQNF